MSNKIIFGIGGVIVGFLLVSVLMTGSFGYRGAGVRIMGLDTESVRNIQVLSDIDKHFIEQMIPHHEGAVAMANLALEKAKRPEIKTLAQAIVSAQESENQQMKGWYRDWFGEDVPEGSAMMGGMMSQGGMHMGGQEDINELNTATDFDKEFVEQMIPHHQMAIMMAQMLQSGTERPEMDQLAKNIISSQSDEIQDMQNWYQEWYK